MIDIARTESANEYREHELTLRRLSAARHGLAHAQTTWARDFHWMLLNYFRRQIRRQEMAA